MGMQLNIQSDEAYRLASRLAELTGESLATAVTEALRRRVAEAERELSAEEKIRRVMAMTDEIRAELLKLGPLPTSDHRDMYDEAGLPI